MPTTYKNSIKLGISPAPKSKIQCMLCDKSFSYTAGIFKKHINNDHDIQINNYYIKFINPKGDQCLCGCGNKTNWIDHAGGRFIDYLHGHNSKNQTKKTSKTQQLKSVKMKQHYVSGRLQNFFKGNAIKHIDDIRKKQSRTMKQKVKDGTFIPPHMRLTADERSKAQQKAYQTLIKRGIIPGGWTKMKRGWYTSSISGEKFWYQSDWERRYMLKLDNDQSVLSWERPTWFIEYKLKENTKRYYPDFFVIDKFGNQQIIEVKGQITDVDLLKFAAAREYSRKNNVKYIIITLNHVSNKFTEISQ